MTATWHNKKGNVKKKKIRSKTKVKRNQIQNVSIPETDPGCQTTEEKNMAIFSMILSLLCGVALFLFGMSLMGDGLKMVAGNKLEAFLYRMTNTPLKGVNH